MDYEVTKLDPGSLAHVEESANHSKHWELAWAAVSICFSQSWITLHKKVNYSG